MKIYKKNKAGWLLIVFLGSIAAWHGCDLVMTNGEHYSYEGNTLYFATPDSVNLVGYESHNRYTPEDLVWLKENLDTIPYDDKKRLGMVDIRDASNIDGPMAGVQFYLYAISPRSPEYFVATYGEVFDTTYYIVFGDTDWDTLNVHVEDGDKISTYFNSTEISNFYCFKTIENENN